MLSGIRIRLTQILLGIILAGCITIVRAAEQVEHVNALLVYGSGGIANWDQEFNAALRDELGPELGQYFTSEILALIGATAEDRKLIADSLALKYSNKNIDLIVAVLSEANDFVTEWVHLFAPNAAILRVLPSDDYLSRENTLDNPVVILASAIDKALTETSRLLPAMLPNLQHIYLISGAGAGDLAYMERYRNTLTRLNLPYEYHYLSGLPADELLETLAQAPPDSAVMTTTYDVDRSGRPMRALILTRQMVANLQIPVLAMANPQINAGAIGGNVTTASAYARTARQLIADMLNNQYPSEPVTPDNDYMFNGEQLDRFNVDRGVLPPGSVILHDPPDLWRDYGPWIVVGTLVIIAQGFLIILLLEARRRSRLAEIRLAQVSKMEALGTLAGGIAHDFNNILMSIMANTELLGLRGDRDEESKKRLAKILSASERAKSLIAQILMFSRKSGNAELHVLNMRNLIDESVEQVSVLLPSGCRVKVSGSENPPAILGDSSQLYQVVMNLCMNAQQAMRGQGVIEVRVKSQRVAEELPVYRQVVPIGDYVLLSVTDTGDGISKADMEHIFEPFFTTKPHGEGTGLGLSLVYQIVKSHNGYIDVRSEPDAGTTVTVYFPVTRESSGKQAKQEMPLLMHGNSEHILLVDDDELVLDANRELFFRLGYQVSSFSSSIEALKSFQHDPNQYDLVFTDLSMPEMDGVRLISNIRKVSPQIPVILCTGYLDALESSELSDVQVLKKPTPVSELARAIQGALGHKSAN